MSEDLERVSLSAYLLLPDGPGGEALIECEFDADGSGPASLVLHPISAKAFADALYKLVKEANQYPKRVN